MTITITIIITIIIFIIIIITRSRWAREEEGGVAAKRGCEKLGVCSKPAHLERGETVETPQGRRRNGLPRTRLDHHASLPHVSKECLV